MSKTVTATELTDQIDAIVARKDAVLRELTPQQMLWRPQNGSWSIAECLDHLNRALSIYLKTMRVTFERERHNVSLPPKAFRLGFLGRQFATFLEPPYRIKAKAPAEAAPEVGLNTADIDAEFTRTRLELRGFVLEASRVDMSSIHFDSPWASMLRLNLAEGCLVALAHDRRHLWQAENVRNHASFPKNA